MMRQPAPAYGSENVGDVLASIRRLIAQDEATSPIIPNQTLNTLPRGLTAVPAQDAPRPLETALAPVETMPLAQVAQLGGRVAGSIEGFGRFVCFCLSAWRWMVQPCRSTMPPTSTPTARAPRRG